MLISVVGTLITDKPRRQHRGRTADDDLCLQRRAFSWRWAALPLLAAGNSRRRAEQGIALAIGKVISELVDRARPFVADPHGVHLFSSGR